MVLLRLIQGFFLAGELPCSITYVVEEVPARASLVSGLVIFCLNSGVLTATLISFALHATLSPADVESFGWRLAFAFGGILGLLSYALRRSLEESQEFKALKEHKVTLGVITRLVLRLEPRPLASNTALCALASFDEAARLLKLLRLRLPNLSSFELMWQDFLIAGSRCAGMKAPRPRLREVPCVGTGS